MIISSSLLVIQCLLLGSMIFFAAVVAPSVFRFVPEREAGLFLRGMFPRYYLWGVVLSMGMTVLAALISPTVLAASVLVLVLFVIARQVLMPAINEARDQAKQGDDGAQKRFAYLHRISVIINLTQMLLLLALTIHLL